MKQEKKKGINESIYSIIKSKYAFPIFLLFLTFLTYGIFIPVLGFHGDDFSLAWLMYKIGTIAPFTTSNRPALGFVDEILAKLLSPSPWLWHLVFTFLRWILALQVFHLFQLLKFKDARVPYWCSLLFLIYPGALIYYQSVTFTGVFIPLTFLVTSFWCSMLNPQSIKHKWVLALVGIALEIANLIIIEYFYFLELLRYPLIWFRLRDEDPKIRMIKASLESLPYFIVFFSVSLYRAFFQTSIVHYEPILFLDFLSHPLTTILKFIPIAFQDIMSFGVKVWLNIFQPQSFFAQMGKNTTMAYFSLVSITGTGIYLFFRSRQVSSISRTYSKKWIVSLIVIGLFGLFLAGLPPRIAGLFPSLEIVIQNRFSQAFALGAVMVIAGLLFMFPNKSKISLILLTLLCAFSIGQHFFVANQFRYEWIEQKRFYWQLAWRFPTLPAPTTIIADYRGLQKMAENPLSAAINWIYFHEAYGRTQEQAGYYLFYNEDRVKMEMNDLNQPLPPMKTGLIGLSSYPQYHLLAMEYDKGCLRVLDPLTSSLDESLPAYLQKAAAVSDLNREYVEDQAHPAIMDMNIFGVEPPHEWCYYFQKADLARSRGHWDEMLRIKSEAGQGGYFPQDPQEKMIFLYAYIGSGDYQSALTLSRELSAEKEDFRPMIYRIWDKMAVDKPEMPAEIRKIYKMEFACSSSD